MNTIIYISIFTIGIVFGSFFTLAVYRIPRKEDITHVRSHCTTCNHRLNFLDLIPIFSYIFLGGKCRYCGEKIRIRYLLLEIFSGIVFLLIALTRGLASIPELAFIYLFIAGMFIIAGIDKENKIIPNGLCIYELCVAICYLAYKIIFLKANILTNIAGATIIPILFVIINQLIYALKKDEKQKPFGGGDIKYLALIGLMFGFTFQVISIALSSIIAVIGLLIHKYKEIPWGYYISIASIVLIIAMPIIEKLIPIK